MSRNNRGYERQTVRTSATLVAFVPEPRQFRVWTDDISPSGVKLLTRDEIVTDQFYLSIVLQGLEGKLLVAQTVRSEYDDFRKMFLYAVKFLRVCDDSEKAGVMAELQKLEPAQA